MPLSVLGATIEPTVSTTDIRGQQYLYTVDDEVYIVNFEKRNKKLGQEKHQRAVYRITEENGATELQDAGKITGGVYKRKRHNDTLFQFKDEIYMTVTRGLNKKALVYRLQQDTNTWEKVAKIGYKATGFRNQIKDVQIIQGRVYMIVGQHDSLENARQKLGVWSSGDGEEWQKSNVTFEDQEEQVQYVFTESFNTGTQLFVIAKAYRRAIDYVDAAKNLPDQEDIAIFSTVNGIDWNTQRVGSDYDAQYVEVNYLLGDAQIINNELFLTASVQPLQVDEVNDWYEWVDGTVVEDGDTIYMNTYSLSVLWKTDADGFAQSTSLEEGGGTVMRYGEKPHLFSVNAEGIVSAYQISSGEESNIELALKGSESLDAEFALYGTFQEVNGYPVLIKEYQQEYAIVIFDGEQWKQLDPIFRSNEDEVQVYTLFDATYFFSPKEQQLYTLTKSGKLQKTSFGFEGTLPKELQDNIRYSVIESPRSTLQAIQVSVYDRSKTEEKNNGKLWYDIAPFCVIADDSLQWQQFDCLLGDAGDVHDSNLYLLQNSSTAAQIGQRWYVDYKEVFYALSLE